MGMHYKPRGSIIAWGVPRYAGKPKSKSEVVVEQNESGIQQTEAQIASFNIPAEELLAQGERDIRLEKLVAGRAKEEQVHCGCENIELDGISSLAAQYTAQGEDSEVAHMRAVEYFRDGGS